MQELLQVLVSLTQYMLEAFFIIYYKNEYIEYRKKRNLVLVLQEKLAFRE